MKGKAFRWNRVAVVMALAGGLVWLAPSIVSATDPVTVAIEVGGTPGFGATVTAKATVTINDGSTLVGYEWSQAGGAPATLSGTTTDTVTAVLGTRGAYRQHLVDILAEPPGGEDEGEGEEYYGGLQNRFQVAGIVPLQLEEAGAVALELALTTTSGTYHKEVEIVTPLPWTTSTGLVNVPVLVPVVLCGKEQASYNWTMLAPVGSSATLVDAATGSPEFTPDIPGTYQITVTDIGANKQVTMLVIAGLWKGYIVGQDANGRPKSDTACTNCHVKGSIIDMFTPWAQTGHAEIFTANVNNPAGHYSESCVSCHAVGYDKAAANNGIDDQTDWQALVDSGKLTHGATTNWTDILAQFPKSAKLANIQCENCHGPQQSAAHAQGKGQRTTLSSDVCGTCHGEPLRHGRFQQWQLSGHANYELAIGEGTNGSCTKCHSAQGFLAWLPILTGEVPGDPNANVPVTWTADEVHPQTCQTCHDPHAIGTTSGGPTTNATVRISGDTPMLLAGFKATNVGRGAICLTCHNTRRGLKNDATWTVADASRAPHPGAQADILMGQNLALVDVGERGYHSMLADTCVDCHMEATPPPDDFSYNKGGTNHSFTARNDICSKCHAKITTETVQHEVEMKLEELKEGVIAGIEKTMQEQLAIGKTITIGSGSSAKTITAISQIASMDFLDASGRQAIAVTLSDGTVLPATAMNNVKAVPATGAGTELYALSSQDLPKAGWNWCVIEADSSLGVHNPTFVKRALDVSIFAVENLPSSTGGTGGIPPGVGGGPGNGAGAVSCTTPFVYWTEIVAHLPGTNSQRRSDVVARNLANSQAAVKFVLHGEKGNVEATGTVAALGQGVFEDLVGQLKVTDKGALEICSDKPLLVLGRTFNQAENGTFGQFIDGHVANYGLVAGQSADLLGLRQQSGKFRTNIAVMNGGTTEAEVTVTLYDNAGVKQTDFALKVPAGQTIQDLEPYAKRAGKPDIGWGFATVKVTKGSNIQSSASVIDAVTADPVTIPAKW